MTDKSKKLAKRAKEAAKKPAPKKMILDRPVVSPKPPKPELPPHPAKPIVRPELPEIEGPPKPEPPIAIEIQRYSPRLGVRLFPDPKGEWVKFVDAVKAK